MLWCVVYIVINSSSSLGFFKLFCLLVWFMVFSLSNHSFSIILIRILGIGWTFHLDHRLVALVSTPIPTLIGLLLAFYSYLDLCQLLAFRSPQTYPNFMPCHFIPWVIPIMANVIITPKTRHLRGECYESYCSSLHDPIPPKDLFYCLFGLF